MTEKEVFLEITKERKWYVPHYTQQNASIMIKRFKSGKLSFKTLNELFNTYGYKLESKWIKE